MPVGKGTFAVMLCMTPIHTMVAANPSAIIKIRGTCPITDGTKTMVAGDGGTECNCGRGTNQLAWPKCFAGQTCKASINTKIFGGGCFNLQCIADFGAMIGDNVCCDQQGAVKDLNASCTTAADTNRGTARDFSCSGRRRRTPLPYVCPRDKPICTGYGGGEVWGSCGGTKNDTTAPWQLPKPVSGANMIKLNFTMLGARMTQLTPNNTANNQTIEDATKAIMWGIRGLLPESFRYHWLGNGNMQYSNIRGRTIRDADQWPTTFAESSLVLPRSVSVDVTISIPVPPHEIANIGQIMSTLYNKSLPCMKPQNPYEWNCAACYKAFGDGKYDSHAECVGDAGQNLKNLAGSIAQSILYGKPIKSHSRSNPSQAYVTIQPYTRIYPDFQGGTRSTSGSRDDDINIVIRSLATAVDESATVWFSTTPAPTSCTSEHARAILFGDFKRKIGKECLADLETPYAKANGDPYGHRTCEKLYGRRRTSKTNVASQTSNRKYSSRASVEGNAECYKGSCRCQLHDMSCNTAKGITVIESNLRGQSDCRVIGCVLGLQFPDCTKYDRIVSSADGCPGGMCRDGMCLGVPGPAPTPPPTPAGMVKVMMLKYTVSNVDFTKLTPELTANMVTAVAEAVLEGLGRDYTKDDIAVLLKAGSVVAEVTVTPKGETAAHLLAKNTEQVQISMKASVQKKVVAVLTQSDGTALTAGLAAVKTSSATPKVVTTQLPAAPSSTNGASSVSRGVATALMAGAAGLVVTTQA